MCMRAWPAADLSCQGDSHKANGCSVSLTSIEGSILRQLAFYVHLMRSLITLSDYLQAQLQFIEFFRVSSYFTLSGCSHLLWLFQPGSHKFLGGL